MAWLLRSPHTDGLHLAVRKLQGARESTAHLVRWKQGERCAEVVDAQLLPAGIQAIAWHGATATKPFLFAACSDDSVHVIDLADKTNALRSKANYVQSSTLGADVAWAGLGDQNIVFVRGGHVSSIDAERGTCVWNFPGHRSKTVSSMSKVNSNEIIASWADPAGGAKRSGCIQMLDLRTRPELHSSQSVLVQETRGVHGLCCSTLEPFLAASYSLKASSGTHDELYIWDLRRAHKKCEPVRRLHSDSSQEDSLKIGAKQHLSSLEWSPSKKSTLLALGVGGQSGGDSASKSVQTCQLWQTAVSDDGAEAQTEKHDNARESLTSWIGQPSAVHGGAAVEDASASAIVAASWAHNCLPGTVMLLHKSGAISASAHRSRRMCAWSPRGGGLVVRQWHRGAVTQETSKSLTLTAGGAPPVLEADPGLATSDPCCLMRSRAERYSYGVQRLSYDEYSRAVRATGSAALNTEALAAVWQWAKLVDNSDGDLDQELEMQHRSSHKDSGKAWKGAQELLHMDGDCGDEVEESSQGVPAFASDGRKQALQALGFPHFSEQEYSNSSPDSVPLPVDEVIRRILRAIVWLHLERAAVECEALEAFCGGPTGRIFLSQLVLVLHAASCVLLRAGDTRNADRDKHDTRSHVFKAARESCSSLSGRDMPFLATLKLAIQFVEEVVTSFTVASHDPKKALTGARARSPFVQKVCTLLMPHSQSTLDSRASVSFRYALAMRFLPQDDAETIFEAIYGECLRGGLLDGLCLRGLGGAPDATPLVASTLEEFIQASHVRPAPQLATQAYGYPTGLQSSMKMQDKRSNAGSKIGSPKLPQTVDDGGPLVEAYVDRTGDVQSAALLLSHAAHLAQPPLSLRRFLAQYAALLARWRMWQERAGLHSLLAARLPPDETARGRSALIYCYYCNGPLTGELRAQDHDMDSILRRCPNPNCGKPTPSCSVCLLSIFVVRSQRDGPHRAVAQGSCSLAVDSWVAWCQSCHHGGHVAHLEDWFSKHDECPVPGCDCLCYV